MPDANTMPHGLTFRCMSQVQPRPISWLWEGRIARGKVMTIAGHPGLGKSQLSLKIAATISTGGQWPVNGATAPRGRVIILSAEDDAEDTIRPRLEAAGADLDRCLILDAIQEHPARGRRAFSLKTDLENLSRLLQELADVALIIIDPITAYLGGIDANNNAEVRSALAPLAEIAARFGVAVIAVSHLRKNNEGDAILQVSGSLAFVAAARAAFLVARDQQQGDRRLFLPMKNNIGNDTTGYAFRVEQHTFNSGIITSRIVWEQTAVETSATEALAAPREDGLQPKLETAIAFLRTILADSPLSSKRVEEETDAAGLSWATVRRAANEIGVGRQKTGFGDQGEWVWVLPRPTGIP